MRRPYQPRPLDHPRDRSSDYRKLRHWTELARLLERGLFDGLFIADILGVYDVYQGGIEVTAREAVQLPVNDPLMLVSAMAGSPSTWVSASPPTSPTRRPTRSPGGSRPSTT